MPQNKEAFRDSISTVNNDGKRVWVYPKKPGGKFYTYRKWVSYFLLTFLIVSPFIKVQGNQFLMFNILERRFNIFGFPFWPQDFYLFVLSMIIAVLFIVLFTVVWGRIFCGWICPQTIFMEMVFRRIEYWIDGDRGSQIRLEKQPWNAEKIRKRVLKWSIFSLISFLISNIFTAYLIGSDALFGYILDGPFEHFTTFIAVLIFSAVFYFIFVWFREQVCIIACPYGRLQSVLLDNQSVIVAYDYRRGEGVAGRKKFRKNEDRASLGYGDCIDCNQCVQVCPTGIDIRNGTQLECVNCTACIDACDEIMEKTRLPKGLIRYASEDNIADNKPFVFTVRMKAYTAVLVVLIGILVGLLFLRSSLEAKVLRLPGQLYQIEANDRISNVYTFKIINKTNSDYNDVQFKILSPEGAEIQVVSKSEIKVPSQGMVEGTLFIRIDRYALENDKTQVKIELYAKGEKIATLKTIFLSPRTFN